MVRRSVPNLRRGPGLRVTIALVGLLQTIVLVTIAAWIRS
jgi:hypothetical protein